MHFKKLFNFKTKQKFNCFAVTKLFNGDFHEVVVGHCDGTLRTFKIPTEDQTEAECISSHESKGGVIQGILVADLTRISNADFITADNKGFLTIVSNQQVLSRTPIFQHSINNLQYLKDPAGSSSVVVSSVDGEVCCVSGHSDRWRVRLADIKSIKQLGFRPRVTSLLTTTLNTSHHSSITYTLIATDSYHLLFYLRDNLAYVLSCPIIVTAMCAGKFVSENDFECKVDTPKINSGINLNSLFALQTQVALACESGSIHIMTNFHLYADVYTNVGYAVKRMVRLQGKQANGLDSLVTAGDIDKYSVVEDAKVVQETGTSGWVNCLQAADIDADGRDELIFSCLDNSIQGHKLL